MIATWETLLQKNMNQCLLNIYNKIRSVSLSLSGFNDIDCIVHKLQLCIKASISSVQDVIDIKLKSTKIATHFNHSTIVQITATAISTSTGSCQDCTKVV